LLALGTKVLTVLLQPRTGAEVEALWREYEEAVTTEAKLCKDLDKIEMILQAYEYESTQGHDLQEFFDSTSNKFKTTVGKELAAEVVARRQAAHAHSLPRSHECLDGSMV
jgi:putative hydrolase of HD superfamily